MNRNSTILVWCLVVPFIASTIAFQSITFAQDGVGPGYPGYPCIDLPDGWCYQTPCTYGICTSCGQPGYPCCTGNQCYFADEGYTCMLGNCINPTSQNCGQVGLAACDDPISGPYCFTGVEEIGDCIACGQDYYQPCCPNTQYKCDYGECIGNLCVPKIQAPGGGGDDTGTNGGDGDGDDSLEFCFINTLLPY